MKQCRYKRVGGDNEEGTHYYVCGLDNQPCTENRRPECPPDAILRPRYSRLQMLANIYAQIVVLVVMVIAGSFVWLLTLPVGTERGMKALIDMCKHLGIKLEKS